MEESGINRMSTFGIAAKPGWCFGLEGDIYKGNHGYPTDYQNYQVFYAVKEPASSSQRTGLSAHHEGGHITDVTKIIAESLNLNMT
jgi:hypothetical protein